MIQDHTGFNTKSSNTVIQGLTIKWHKTNNHYDIISFKTEIHDLPRLWYKILQSCGTRYINTIDTGSSKTVIKNYRQCDTR